jgi:HD superfamily phosphohydrolase
LEKDGYEPKVIASIAVKHGMHDGPLYLQDMLNQRFDLDVLDTNMRWSNIGITKVKIDALQMLRAYTIFNGRLVFNGKYLNDVKNIISARRALVFERKIEERAQSEVAHYMLRKAIDEALASNLLNKDFVFLDDWQLLHILKHCKPSKGIIQRMLMGQPYTCIDIKKIDEKAYKQISEQASQLESEIAEKTNSQTIEVIVRTKLYHLPEATYPVLIDNRLKPVSQLVDVAKEKFEGRFLFIYHSSPMKDMQSIVDKCVKSYV